MKVLTGMLAGGVMTVALLAGCGDSGPSDEEKKAAEASEAAASAASASVASEASQSAADEQARLDRIAEEQAVYDACKRLTRGLTDSLQEIDSRLDVGLNYNEYSDFLGDASVAVDKMVNAFEDEDADCFRAVARPLAKAYDKYAAVLRVWAACIDDFYCDFSTGAADDKAQTGWAAASDLLDRAHSALEDLEPVQ